MCSAGAAKHLAHQREWNNNQNRHGQNCANHSVHVEPEIDEQALRRNRQRGEVAGQMRPDKNICREHEDDDNQHRTGCAARSLQYQRDQDRTADDTLSR